MLSYLNTPAKQALRVSTSLPCLMLQHSASCRRLFHSSTTPRAVQAAAASQSSPSTTINHAAHHAVQPRSRVPPGQLNITQHRYKPSFYDAVAKTMQIRQQYIEKRCVFIESHEMLPLLIGLGARPEDLPLLAGVSEHLVSDPTLAYRLSRSGRFLIDYDSLSLQRLEFQPFTLTFDEDFKRYDSGQIRYFDEMQNDLQLNTFLQALFIFKAMVIYGVEIAHRPLLRYDCNKYVCTLFNLRTFTNSQVLGEPALEGVHADGVDHTMTTFLGAKNMSDNSAVTFMHDMNETTGIPFNQASPANLLARVQHRKILDTLILVDHERKHSLSPVYPIDDSKEATRDMLIFFTRRPVEKTHVSGAIDSLVPHTKLPMNIPIFVPRN
ncbi:hypothetical protein CDD81_6068 [Ophiocordyceps australis]|uniref:2OG-Fe dioxygenase-domain-containing protein n=1 Tax=Ophiocordyceps australis TaxID=1399860 RepID=A0A2C5Y911_9HYPO|nr:hypothetical protein CDD81_6068 [Ophiocordyceps australis]